MKVMDAQMPALRVQRAGREEEFTAAGRPAVPTPDEARRLFGRLSDVHALQAELMYGSGLRVLEVLRLRVRDIDFARMAISICAAGGEVDRVVLLPDALVPRLQEQLRRARAVHEKDLAGGGGATRLPPALEKKYPQADRRWCWQYVFPADRLSVDLCTGRAHRPHLDEQGLQHAIARASRGAALPTPVHAHTLRHAFATRQLESGSGVRALQALLGHKDLHTTLLYTQVLSGNVEGLTVPLETLAAS
jgi:integrase